MRSPLPALARWVACRPRQALGVLALLTVVMGVCARDVRLDNNFAGLFSTSSADATFREDYRRAFGADDGLLVAVLQADEATDRMYDTVGAVSDAVATMPEIEFVDSMSTVPEGPFGSAFLVSEDRRTTLVVGNLASRYDSYEKVTGPADDFRRIVDGVVERAGHPVRVQYAGVAFTRIAAISEMQGDLVKLFPVATVMMAALLWWFFRRPVAVIGPMVAIVVSTVSTAGVIGLAGDDINQITIIYPVLLMGVVVATATHLIHRFYRERAAGADAETAARTTLERISRAAIVCTVTNAIGFVSLLTAKMAILHEFGLYLAAGVGFCFVATSLAIPALLVLRNSEPPDRYLRPPAPQPVDTDARRRGMSVRSAALVYAGGLVIVIASVLVATTARYDYSLSGMLNADRPTSVGNALIDDELSGIVPIEVSVKGAPGSMLEPANVARLRELDRWIADHEGVDPVGFADAVDWTGQDAEQVSTLLAGLPPTDPLRVQVGRIITDDHGWTRLRGFHRDTGATDIVALAGRIDAEGADLFAGTGVEVRVTGEAPVAYEGMNELSRELILATIVAIALIVVAIGIAFRSLTLALVALLPNVAPIAAGLAIYTVVKEVLDPVAGVVFCVAMGLAADDTVHLLNRFRELRPAYPTSREALAEALATVQRAMVSSSAVLIASFLALGVSGFPTNRTLGLLGSLVLLLALGSDLLFGTAGLALAGARADRRGTVL